ncbi:septum formation initiator family protein [Sinomonas sp. JGH33]|uniref:Septum formation initiator family protein n=1 Tax=Sinomonas terricola TaxID=3110330 RepID=A0ABU5T9P8_9MICC|nr:septum formation initiator family protein [Sinomonas sp. JGH33]MEA5456245.1 septum formation initiator family protein [Sinomonas sp. JGH33]
MATRRPQVPRASRGTATGMPARPHAVPEPTALAASSKPAPAAKPAGRASLGGAAKASARPSTTARPSTAAARAAARDQADAAPVPARAFSGRIVALVLVLVAVTVMLAPTVRVFLGQRAEIQTIQADIAAKQGDQANLKSLISRWQDPAYIQQQARDRINMVMPGETSYWVFGDAASSSASNQGSATGASPGTAPSNVPWTQSLWDSVRRAATD